MKKQQHYYYYSTIFASLDNCKTLQSLKQIHGLMIATSLTQDIIPVSKLIDFCTNSQPPQLSYAESIFLQIRQPSVYIWNSIIKGHSNAQNTNKALSMYKHMQHLGYSPDHFTFPFVLKACAAGSELGFGECIHNRVLKSGFGSDLYASTSLVHMYVSCGDIEGGEKLFDEIPMRNVVAWTSLIAGYVNKGRAGDAIRVFKDMGLEGVEANEVTMVNVLVACAQSKDFETGKWVHHRIRQIGFIAPNVILDTAILDMYAKCGRFKLAKELFSKMPQRNEVAFNSMIGACTLHGQYREALKLFADMQQVAGFKPDEATMLSLLTVSARLGAVSLGRELHGYIEKSNIAEGGVAIGTSLLEMYAKSGDTESAFQIFNGLPRKDVKAWTSMIMGLAVHGHGKEALDIFSEMQKDGTVNPDHITYIGVLTACSHAGLVDEGYTHFDSMRNVYGLIPTEEHYGCMVDILSRAGKLKEANNLAKTMPIKPNVTVWGALLNGCHIHDNVDLAEEVENQLLELRPEGSGVYVLLANIYAKAGRWEGVERVRNLMRCNGYGKTYGWSLIETKLLSYMNAPQKINLDSNHQS